MNTQKMNFNSDQQIPRRQNNDQCANEMHQFLSLATSECNGIVIYIANSINNLYMPACDQEAII